MNIHGKSGKNISLDLHMEHLNKKCKQAISHLGANVAGGTIERVGRSLKNLTDIQLQYDKNTGVPIESGYDTRRKASKDFGMALQQLQDAKVFSGVPQRQHREFSKFQRNSMQPVNKEELKDWMKRHLKKVFICSHTYYNFLSQNN